MVSSLSDLHFMLFSKQLEYYEQHVLLSYITYTKDEFFTTYREIATMCKRHVEIMTLWNMCLANIQQIWSSPVSATAAEICLANFDNFRTTWADLKTDMYKECLEYMEQCASMDCIFDVAYISNVCCGYGHGTSHEEVDRSITNACLRIFRQMPPPPLSRQEKANESD